MKSKVTYDKGEGFLDNKFIHLHQHDINSNMQYLEVVSTLDDYIEQAIERGLPAVNISNHGNIIDWYDRKTKIEANGMKFIHSIEAYVTDSSDEKIRDNFHLILIAKNEAGWRELNKLSSKSFTRTDNHFYYAPRMYSEEIFSTSDNIIITSACLGSPFWQYYKNGDTENFNKWVNFFVENKHRTYFEVQPHLDDEQKEYNKVLIGLSKEYGVPILATNDVHAVSKEHEFIRKELKKSKGVDYETDDNYELWAKDYDEMVESFKKQGVLSDDEIEQSLNTPFEIVDLVESFDVDVSIKYPKMFFPEEQKVGDLDISFLRKQPFKESLDVLKHLIVEGYKERGIYKLSKEEQQLYKNRVNHELKAYIETGSVNYVLLEWLVKYSGINKRINPNKSIHAGYGRGSSSGSLICYLLNIVQVDAVKEDLNFERFINKDRVSIADIDTDYEPSDQTIVQQWLLSNEAFDSASIVTKNTYGLKGSIKVMGKGLGYSPVELNVLTKSIDEKTGEFPADVYNAHKELIDISKKVMGTISSYGRHACGIVITSEPLDEVMGTMTLSGWDYPVTQLNMKAIDKLSFTKLDVLGLDSLELIHKTCEMVGIPNITPYDGEVDFQDPEIYKAMTEDNTGIFQFESPRAGSLLSDMFSEETIERMREINPDFKYLDLMSLLNAGMRPAGASFIQNIVEARPRKWGIKPLDDFLKDSLGELVFQETQTSFLVEMCGWSAGEADLIRRGIGKKSKEIMDKEVPKIKPSFVKTMVEKYGEDREHAEEVAESFVKVFVDSANYGFSLNHSLPYSAYGAVASHLKTKYPLEFVASGLEIWDKGEKSVEMMEFASRRGIGLKPARFRKSKGGYFVDKEHNTIYQGTGHIKGGNREVGDLLFTLKDRQYDYFTDLVLDVIENGVIEIDGSEKAIQNFYKNIPIEDIALIDKECKADASRYTYEKSPLSINRTKMEGLIRLDYFEEFGGGKKLEKVYDYVIKNYKPNNKTHKNKAKKYIECIDYEKSLENEPYSILEQCEYELFYTGRVTVENVDIPAKYAFVTKIDKVGKTRTSAEIYVINKGKSSPIKVGSKLYRNIPFTEGDLISVERAKAKPKGGYSNGVWTQSPTEKELWIEDMKIIRRSKIK